MHVVGVISSDALPNHLVRSFLTLWLGVASTHTHRLIDRRPGLVRAISRLVAELFSAGTSDEPKIHSAVSAPRILASFVGGG